MTINQAKKNHDEIEKKNLILQPSDDFQLLKNSLQSVTTEAKNHSKSCSLKS